MMNQKRLCRRCKKQRSEDEPPEIRKYKTCKNCREIERKKKRLKKLNSLGMNVDGALDEKTASEALNQLNSNEAIIARAAAVSQHHHNLQQHPDLGDLDDLVDDESQHINECEICGKLRTSQDNGRYKKCEQCVYEPTKNPNVYDDFEDYLNETKLNKQQDVEKLIFYKTIPLEIISYPLDPSSNMMMEYDKKGCEITLNEISNVFVKPIMTVTGFQFSRTSSNLSVKPYPKTLKALYRCKQDLKTLPRSAGANVNNNVLNAVNASNVDPIFHLQQETAAPGNAPTPSNEEKLNYRKLKNQNCESYLYLSFDLVTRLLTIKFTHKTHKNYLTKNYSPDLLKVILAYFKRGFTKNFIYNDLKASHELSPILKQEIKSIKKTTFMRDFNPELLLDQLGYIPETNNTLPSVHAGFNYLINNTDTLYLDPTLNLNYKEMKNGDEIDPILNGS